MNKEKFSYHLHEATKQLVDFTKTRCYNEFSDNYDYRITPNSRTVNLDDHHLTEKEISVLTAWNNCEGQLLKADQIIELFHHDNKVPIWVDISVYESRPNATVIDLCCSRRLREERELMHPGLEPFHIQIAIPPDRWRVEVNGKFDVNWKKKSDEVRRPKNAWMTLKELFPFSK